MHTVTLGGVDITTFVGDQITITKRKNVAATAQLTYHPTGAPGFPADLIRKAVTISWDGDRMYTGNIENATWDLSTRTFVISCSDLFQEEFEGKTDAEIIALIPGSIYSTRIFGEREDGWRYAVDCMSTVEKDVFLDRNGALQVVDWPAEVVPDRDYTESNVVNGGAYTLVLMRARDVFTKYNITYNFRVSRWKYREHTFRWDFHRSAIGNAVYTPEPDWCEWAYNGGWNMPTRETIQSAAEGTSWDIKDGLINIDTHPASAPVVGTYCSSKYPDMIWVITDEAQAAVAIGAGWTGTRQWAQTVSEKYTISVQVDEAIALYGLVEHETSASYQPDVDDGSFEQEISGEADTWPLDTVGDHINDQFDEADRTTDIQCLLQMAGARLYDELRKNHVTITTEIDPTLEVSHTGGLVTRDIECEGKVGVIVHNITLASALTTVTMDIARGGGGSPGDALDVPDRPSSVPTHTPSDSATYLGTVLGGCNDALEYDETWMGWSTNIRQYPANLCNDPNGPQPDPEQIYPDRFQVRGPDVEEEAREDLEPEQITAYNHFVPHETLVLK